MHPCTACTLGIINMVCRILVFGLFWWAYDDTENIFSSLKLAFRNDVWAWEQHAITKVTAVYGKSNCSNGTILLTSYLWPGRNGFEAYGTEYPSIEEEHFTQWTLETMTSSFKLCGQTINYTYSDTASFNTRCEERQLKNCGDSNEERFCVGLFDDCPISKITLSLNGTQLVISTNNTLQVSDMPIAQFRVDSNFICLDKNQTNIYPGRNEDVNLKKKRTPCLERDNTYEIVNTINEPLYFEINNAKYHQITDKNYNKTLFYRRYPKWNSNCFGSLFNIAVELNDLVETVVSLSYNASIVSFAYMLIICYILPAIPFLCRQSKQLNIGCLLFVDYLVRIMLTLLMAGYSAQLVIVGTQAENNINTLVATECLVDESPLHELYDLLDENVVVLNVIAIAITLAISGVEIFIWLIILFGKITHWCLRICRRINADSDLDKSYESSPVKDQQSPFDDEQGQVDGDQVGEQQLQQISEVEQMPLVLSDCQQQPKTQQQPQTQPQPQQSRQSQTKLQFQQIPQPQSHADSQRQIYQELSPKQQQQQSQLQQPESQQQLVQQPQYQLRESQPQSQPQSQQYQQSPLQPQIQQQSPPQVQQNQSIHSQPQQFEEQPHQQQSSLPQQTQLYQQAESQQQSQTQHSQQQKVQPQTQTQPLIQTQQQPQPQVESQASLGQPVLHDSQHQPQPQPQQQLQQQPQSQSQASLGQSQQHQQPQSPPPEQPPNEQLPNAE